MKTPQKRSLFDGLRRMRDDTLSYSLTRKYPFHSTTKSLLFLSLGILLGVFTLFNVATNGWDMQPLYTSDPNSTLHTKSWYQSVIFTWRDDKLDPSCQHLEIPVEYKFTTTNLGLLYTVLGISFQPNGATGVPQQSPSLSYLNNTLDNCNVQ